MDEVEILVVEQGAAVCGENGYMLKRSDNVASFYIDGWGDSCRIYPISSSTTTLIDGASVGIPSLTIDNGIVDEPMTEICFPEFEGWSVHSVSGGKTMAICLTKDELQTAN